MKNTRYLPSDDLYSTSSMRSNSPSEQKPAHLDDDPDSQYTFSYGSPPQSVPIPNSSHPLSKKPTIVGSHHHRRTSVLQFGHKRDPDESSVNLVYPPQIIPLPKDDDAADRQTLWQKIVPESIPCRLYVLTVIIETVIDLAIEGELLIRFGNDNQNNYKAQEKMKTYLSIFALAHVFQFAMALDAVYARNTLQFIGLTIFNVLFLIYAGIQIGEIQATLGDSTSGLLDIPAHVLTTLIPCVIGLAELAYIALGWKIYKEFGWKVYKFLGASIDLRQMYAKYQIFACLIKFDVFFWVGFSVQFIILVLDRQEWEFYLTCAALPISLLLLVEGHLGARYESRMLMYTFMTGCTVGLVYFLYKLLRVLLAINSSDPLLRAQFQSIWKSLTTFSVIALLLLIATMTFAILVTRNFNKGLKSALNKRNEPTLTRKGTLPHHRSQSTNLNRMSIE